jgi:protein-S-isoprenylcysteine O-methyltransferase Ste14
MPSRNEEQQVAVHRAVNEPDAVILSCDQITPNPCNPVQKYLEAIAQLRWDGVVSQLRAYTGAELSEHTQGLEDYEWSAGSAPIHGQPVHLTTCSERRALTMFRAMRCRYKIADSCEPRHDHHAALDSRHYGAIRWVNRYSIGTRSASVGTLHASATSRMGRGSPGLWNRIGLIVVAPAVALLIWILAYAIPQAPSRVRLGLTPPFLMMRGPYKFTRNPMYVAELGLWLGWAICFGSLGVLLGFLVLWSVVKFIILPREERGLEAAFGQTYLQYKNKVPRWLGKTR